MSRNPPEPLSAAPESRPRSALPVRPLIPRAVQRPRGLLALVMGTLLGAASVPPAECTETPRFPQIPAQMEAPTLSAVGGSFAGVPSGTPACGASPLQVQPQGGSLRNEAQDVLHGLVPAEGLRSPLDAAGQGYR